MHRRLGKGVQHIPAQALFVNAPFAASTVHVVAALVVVLMAFEIGQGVVPAPTRVTCDIGPVVVIARLTTHVNHAVDAGAAPQDLAARIAQTAPIQTFSGLGVVEPIGARVANAIQVAHGDVHPVVIVFAACFNQQHAVATTGAQAVGEQAARRPRTNDDVVELCVVHLEVGMTNSAPLGVLSGQRCMMDFCLV